MEAFRSFLPTLHRFLGWGSLLFAAAAGLFWNSEFRNLLMGTVAVFLIVRYLFSRLIQKEGFSIILRLLFLYLPVFWVGYMIRPTYPVPPQKIPTYLSENLGAILKARVQEYVIRYRDIQTDARGMFNEDNLNSSYAEGNSSWNSQENAITFNTVSPANNLPVVLLQTKSNLKEATTDSLQKVTLSALTTFPVEVVTPAARENSLQEAMLSNTGITTEQVKFGQLKNPDYIYSVSITHSKLSPGFRIEVTLQEAYSGTVRRQLRGYAQDERELASLLALGPAAIIKR